MRKILPETVLQRINILNRGKKNMRRELRLEEIPAVPEKESRTIVFFPDKFTSFVLIDEHFKSED